MVVSPPIGHAEIGAAVVARLIISWLKGLVPIESLPGDRYVYHENVRKIIGQRTRRTFSIGDPVRVLLDRVDPLERKLQFSIVEPVRTKPQIRKGKKGRNRG